MSCASRLSASPPSGDNKGGHAVSLLSTTCFSSGAANSGYSDKTFSENLQHCDVEGLHSTQGSHGDSQRVDCVHYSSLHGKDTVCKEDNSVPFCSNSISRDKVCRTTEAADLRGFDDFFNEEPTPRIPAYQVPRRS